MRYLGIDYGTKRVGLALSDSTNLIARPYRVLGVDADLLSQVEAIIKSEGVDQVVIGESKDLRGGDNPVMKKIKRFGQALAAGGVAVVYEPEFYTSIQAERELGKPEADARAAALILQTWLDRQNQSQLNHD